jgi:F-type H+-transporting ATPase subunit epsilon
MGNLHLEVVTPQRILISQNVESVVVPGSLGEFGVLEGHVPFLSGIVPGELRFTAGGKTERFVVASGFAEISENKVSILVDAAESARDVDLERARKALERAKERLAKRGAEELDFVRAEGALRRAMARIKVAEKQGQ